MSELYTLVAVTLRDIVDAGGPVVYGILLACFLLWALIILALAVIVESAGEEP